MKTGREILILSLDGEEFACISFDCTAPYDDPDGWNQAAAKADLICDAMNAYPGTKERV